MFLKDISGVGRKFEVKQVSDGYARNFLLPHGLAKLATQEDAFAVSQRQNEKKKKDLRADEKLKSLAAGLGGVRLEIKSKADSKGKLYGSITTDDFVRALASKEIKVLSHQIDLPASIKIVGEGKVKIILDRGFEVEISYRVIPE